MNTFRLKACPKCQGDLYLQQDIYGQDIYGAYYWGCLQCGRHYEMIPALTDRSNHVRAGRNGRQGLGKFA